MHGQQTIKLSCKFNDVYKVATSSVDSLADFCNIACEELFME